MPTYDQYKAAVRDAFPQLAKYIAVRHKARDIFDTSRAMADIVSQIDLTPGTFLSSYMRLEFHKGDNEPDTPRTPAESFAHLSGVSLYDDDEKSAPIEGCYILTPRQGYDVKEVFNLMTYGRPVRAAQDFRCGNESRDLLAWFSFFHELGHARRAIGTPYREKSFSSIRKEERTCDAFAALMLLKRDGKASLPLIRDLIKLREIKAQRFAKKKQENEHDTAAALSAVLARYESGRLNDLAKRSGNELFRMAIRFAERGGAHLECKSAVKP